MRNSQPLADNVQALTFNYYNSDGSTPSNNSKIRYTTIAITIDNDFNFKTGVVLWNLI